MHYCNNCKCYFDRPRRARNPYPDFGGETVYLCPLCGAPEDFETREGKEKTQ